MERLCEHPAIGVDRLPYRRAALSFMKWQVNRGLLEPTDSNRPGSPWWRAVNEDLLRATAEAGFRSFGTPGRDPAPDVAAGMEFIADPGASTWYRAHNMAIVRSYIAHAGLAEQENSVERFFMNLVLLRVLYTHAMVTAPGLALGWLSPVAPLLGDPRLGFAGIFLSISRVLPDTYPPDGRVAEYAAEEHGFGRLLDLGIILPRITALYEWSAGELGIPELVGLQSNGVPAYCWDPADREHWDPSPTGIVKVARKLLPH